MARGSQDIVKKNSKLESFLHRSLTAETFDRVRGYESCICVSEKENKAFKYVILSDEWIYLTENPPKTIKGVVHLRDVVNVELINDYPEFLSGEEQRNTQHIAITHVTSEPARKRSLRHSRNRHRSPRGSIVDLHGDRSNNSTPVGYASSLDGSEDVGYSTQSTASLPRSRPTSRGSISSQRGIAGIAAGVSGNSKKKKKSQLALNESWEQDSILRSLKEEIEEDMLEDIEEDSISMLKGSHASATLRSANGRSRGINSSSLERQRSFNSQLSRSGGRDSGHPSSSLNNSQSSVGSTGRPLPPQPKTRAFETVAASTKDKTSGNATSDSAGVVLSPVQVTSGDSGCSCSPFFFRSSRKSQVAPMCTDVTKTFNNSSTPLVGEQKLVGVPSVAISTMSDDGRDSRTSRQSSLMGGGPPGSRSNTPSFDNERLSSMLPSELSGSTSALNTLSVDSTPDSRQTVLHIYLLNDQSPMIMLMRGAWSNYLIRATMALDPGEGVGDNSSVLLPSKNQREKCELLFNQLKQQLFDPNNSIAEYFQLFSDLKRATEKNFLMKKLFWRTGDILSLMTQQLKKYMPLTEANLSTEDGRAQRVDELEFVILLLRTLCLMFRESEILHLRIQTLRSERAKNLVDLMTTLTSALNMPEKQILLMKHWSAPSKMNRFGSNTTLNRDGELYHLLSEYIRVSITAVFEMFVMAKQNQFESEEGVHLTVNWLVKVLEDSKNTMQFTERVMSQVLEVINLARFGNVSPPQAVRLFQQFSVLLHVLDHSGTVLAFLRNHYHEEFKYFIQGPALARKLPQHFPITTTTIKVVSQVSTKVLGKKPSRPRDASR